MTDRAGAHARGYNSRWHKARLAHLAQFPLCAKCQTVGRIVPATTVDHLVPHRGDQALFWDRSNWQSLCTTHHNAAKQREERRGVQMGVDVEGRPTDPEPPLEPAAMTGREGGGSKARGRRGANRRRSSIRTETCTRPKS